MAQFPSIVRGYPSDGTDFSAKYGWPIKINSSKQADLADTQGEVCSGILVNTCGTTGTAEVQHAGICMAVGNGAINQEVPLTVGAGGKLEAAAAGDYIIAKSIEACAGDGKLFEVQIVHGGIKP